MASPLKTIAPFLKHARLRRIVVMLTAVIFTLIIMQGIARSADIHRQAHWYARKPRIGIWHISSDEPGGEHISNVLGNQLMCALAAMVLSALHALSAKREYAVAIYSNDNVHQQGPVREIAEQKGIRAWRHLDGLMADQGLSLPYLPYLNKGKTRC